MLPGKTCLRFKKKFLVILKSNPELSHNIWEGIKAAEKGLGHQGTKPGDQKKPQQVERAGLCLFCISSSHSRRVFCFYLFFQLETRTSSLQIKQLNNSLLSQATLLQRGARLSVGKGSRGNDFHIDVYVTYHLIQRFLSPSSWGHSAIPTVQGWSIFVLQK